MRCGTPSATGAGEGGGRPAPTPTCVAHLPQHVGLQRLGLPGADGPEQPPTRVSPSGVPEAGAQGEAGPAQGP